MSTTDSAEPAVTATLDAWAAGIRAHRPDDVASVFTDDAIFQGFDPVHTVGRAGIAAYYDKQPLGLRAEYEIREIRPISADAVLAYVRVDFTPPEAAVIPVHLTAVLRSTGGDWLISHYHVSKIEQPVAPVAATA
ncbi:uncharacterized protein (TIGR02246 family) [Diaminobutyricimonas aerilata]|uniref:Uncharacterized protein (TIGR02246 family) n=1 Tax=Diaminobutyricimonas aerilata TaxID=1162967 RepID=A0A2M9CNJ7_9MICO|nr:SgcJ/EcaC family oxidoreductase [Diaminobutyricimonas aerilata]PJJ73424.1 uncharacterized protein (TIGR02246 family) [Diaminobutyricimonas aerilata]